MKQVEALVLVIPRTSQILTQEKALLTFFLLYLDIQRTFWHAFKSLCNVSMSLTFG